MNRSADQKDHVDKALKDKREQDQSSHNHPAPGQTAGEGMHRVEREKPITPGEKSQD